MIRLGITADLSPNGSIHQQTFIRAIKLGYEYLNLNDQGIELIWENDCATSDGGKKAAKNLINQGVDFIIGHYASAAAKSALPFYQNQKIPVFLPAATSDQLTQSFNCAFRTCGKDSDLAHYIKSKFENEKKSTFFITHDKSEHGINLSNLILKAFETVNSIRITNNLADAINVIYVGNFTNSVHFLKENLHLLKKIDEVYFTDDLVHPALPQATCFYEGKISIFGYIYSKYCKTAEKINLIYYERWRTYPFTYFLETFSSLEIIQQLLKTTGNDFNRINTLKSNTWKTVLGNLSFDKNGDCGLGRFAKWQVNKNKLMMIEKHL